MTYLEKGLRNLGSSFTIGFLAVVAGYLTRMFLARTLAIEDFGLVYAAITTVAFLTIFTNLGFGSAQAKYIPHYHSRNESEKVAGLINFSFYTRLAFSIIIACAITAFSGWFGEKYFKSADPAIVYITALGIVLITVFNTLSRVFQGFQKIFLMSFMEFFQKTLFLLLILLAFLNGRFMQGKYITGIYALSILGAILFALPFFSRLRKSLKRAVINKELVKCVLIFCASAVMAQTGFMIVENLNTVMLTYLGTLKDVAIFNVVLPSTMALIFLGKSLSSVLLPLISEMWAKGEKESIKPAVQLVNKYVLFITLPVILAVIVFPEFFLKFFFGSSFVEGSNALRVLCFGAFFLNLSLAYQATLSAVDKIKYVTSSIIIAAVVNILLNLVFIPLWGYNGASIATTITFFILLSQNIYNLREFISLKKEFAQLIKLFGIGVLFLAVAFALRGIRADNLITVAAVLVSCSLVYTAFCFATGIVSIKEFRFLINKARGAR
jgi:O-antigen/teichoic acid export membrane protein